MYLVGNNWQAFSQGDDLMSIVEEDNKALVRRYIDLLNKKALPTEEAIAPLASNIVYHRPGMPDVTGLTGMRQVVEMSRNAIPDRHGTIEELVAEGDKVACRYSGRGTHQGDMMGVAATGKAISVTGICIYRIANGKIQEEWDYSDVLGLLQQLGVSGLCRDRCLASIQAFETIPNQKQ